MLFPRRLAVWFLKVWGGLLTAHKLGTWQALSSPMDLRQTETNHHLGDQTPLNFCNGIQRGGNIKRERESLPQVLEEEVEEAEDHRPTRAEAKKKVLITHLRQHRRSPDLTGLDAMR